MASNFPWLTFHHAADKTTIVEHKQAYSSLALPAQSARQQHPTLIAFLGRSAKTAILRHIFSDAGECIQSEPHGQVRLCSLPRTRRSDFPILFADCEVHNERISQSRPFTSGGPEVSHRILALEHHDNDSIHGTQRGLGIRLYAQALAPIVGVYCLFAADMGGIHGISETLSMYVRACEGPRMPQAALPRVLIILSTASASFDGEIVRRRFIDSIALMLNRTDSQEAESLIFTRFHNIHVIGLSSTATQRERQKCLYSRTLHVG